MSSPSPEEWKKIAALVDNFAKRPDAEPFREPVPWEELGLVDYLKVIKTPMDLGTVKSKLKARKYRTIFEVGQDVRLIWKNCMTYNQDGSDFYKLADSLSRKWDDRYNKLLGDMALGAAAAASSASAGAATAGGAAGPGENASQIKDRQAFARSLYGLSKEDLGRVLVELDGKCPASITRNAQEDEVELNVDRIPPSLLAELQNFVAACQSKSKKKKTGGASAAAAKK